MSIIHDFYDINVLRPVHNNVIGTFSSNTLTTPDSATITIDGSTFKFSPNLANVFKLNIKDILSTIVNSGLFSENKPNYTLPGDTILKGNSVFIINMAVVVTQGVSTDTDTITIRVYNGVKNNENDDALDIPVNGFDLLHTKSIDGFKMVYNEGFPFDISFYCNENLSSTTRLIELKNITTDNTKQLNVGVNPENRLVLCDGATDLTIENVLPITSGLNKMKLTVVDNPTNIIYFNIEKKESCDGTYIKWMNEFGEWNYWLFVDFNEVSEKIKPSGFLSKDLEPIEKTISPRPSLGANDDVSLKVSTGIITPEDYTYFYSIFKSPKIYLYTGKRFSQKTNTQWKEVTIDGTFITNKPKGINYEFDMEFNITKTYTQGI